MATVRNPISGFAIMIFGTLGLTFLIALPVQFLPQPELVYFYLPFALFGAGVLAGRGGFLGSIGFIGGTLGSFFGLYTYRLFLPLEPWPLWPAEWGFLLDFGFAAACGLGGLVIGRVGLKRMERVGERAPKNRRCARCGAQVGIAARKCWSCRAYLPPT